MTRAFLHAVIELAVVGEPGQFVSLIPSRMLSPGAAMVVNKFVGHSETMAIWQSWL